MAQRIELWPVERLKPYANNARTHDADQVTKIAASITEFGFTNPILVDSADGIIAGHGRLMAATQLGLSEVPVIVLDLFGGSGSTLIACENLRRVGRLMELEPKYVDVIIRRWQDYTGKHARLEASGQTFDEVADERSGDNQAVAAGG